MSMIYYKAVNTKTGEIKESGDLNFLIMLVDNQNLFDFIDYGVEYKITDWNFSTEIRGM